MYIHIKSLYIYKILHMYTNHPSIILPFDPHLPWHRTAPWQNFRKNTAIGFHSQGQWSHIDEHDVFHLPFYPPVEEFLQTFQNSTANTIDNQKHTSFFFVNGEMSSTKTF